MKPTELFINLQIKGKKRRIKMGNFFLYESELGAVMWQGGNWAYDKLGNMGVAIKCILPLKYEICGGKTKS